MNPITHLEFGWALANTIDGPPKRRLMIMAAGLVADLDGMTILFGQEAYQVYHHSVTHNFVFGALLALGLTLLFDRSVKAALLIYLSYLVHLGCDLVGTIWEMKILVPFSQLQIESPVNWPLNSWQNYLVTAILAMIGLWIAVRYKRTPFELVWPSLDRVLVTMIDLRWRKPCGVCQNGALYRCEECGQALCSNHVLIKKMLHTFCPDCSDS
ncbi:MAG: zinc finger HIT domain-containing protein [Gammaproteobacteria bacterium]|jgi:membrane-bound metal-dependent hydrolase YbcI (DUF457 family)/DNA-directed RNA polymerase subunit RPC12/RpoP|nr:zinc finger HIT domain-containing protein [Gammaproteobacteria bacterium]